MATQLIMIESLMCLMSCTRSDIAYTVSKLSKYVSNPEAEWLKGTVRALRFTHSYGLHNTRYSTILDKNWIFDMEIFWNLLVFKLMLGGLFVLDFYTLG